MLRAARLRMRRRREGCGSRAPRSSLDKGRCSSSASPLLSDQPGPLHPRQEACHVCTPPCTPRPQHPAFRHRATGAQPSHEMRPAPPERLGTGQPGHPDPATEDWGHGCVLAAPLRHWRYPIGHTSPAAPLPTGSHSSPALFRPALKLVNTWTCLTKHPSRRKWGVCRNTPLHIVMADINSMLITLCTFQSHILKPFR